MFDLVNGLPVHPLVVHAVVVLLPLTVVGTLAIAFRPAWRATYGHLVLAAAVASVVLIPVATSSGEALERHVGDPGEHAELGDQLIWFALPLLLLVAGLIYLDRTGRGDLRRPTAAVAERTTALTAVAALACVAALATTVQVYRVGDSGARAAWGDQVTQTIPEGAGGDGD